MVLKLTKDNNVLRNGFIVGKIKYIKDGSFEGYSFFPEYLEGINFYLEELRVIESFIYHVKIKRNKL